MSDPIVLPMHTQTVCVAGTHDWSDDGKIRWYVKGSPFLSMLEKRGMCPYFSENGDTFLWDTDLGGIGCFGDDHRGWKAWGHVLKNHCAKIPSTHLQIITHSHGIQPALYAAKYGLKIDRLISVTGPVRRDMQAVVKDARPNIRYWRHVYTDFDWWQAMGGLAIFDRQLGWRRKFSQADNNVKIPGIGHTGLFNDERHLEHWEWLI